MQMSRAGWATEIHGTKRAVRCVYKFRRPSGHRRLTGAGSVSMRWWSNRTLLCSRQEGYLKRSPFASPVGMPHASLAPFGFATPCRSVRASIQNKRRRRMGGSGRSSASSRLSALAQSSR
eukprot:5187510-Prymnesium_polylepis.1